MKGRILSRAYMGLLVIGLALLSRAALAQNDDAERLGIQIRNSVEVGKQLPALIFQPRQSVERVTVQLTRGDDHAVQNFNVGAIRKGETRAIEFEQPEGTHEYEAVLRGHWKGGKDFGFGFSLSATSVPPLKITVSKADVNLLNHTVRLRLSRPAGKVEMKVIGDGGQILDEVEKKFDGEPAGTPLTIGFSGRGTVVEKIAIRGFDENNFWAGIEVSPFTVVIPHEEVVFEFGKWDVRASEENKLRDSLNQLQEALRQHGREIEIQLYIAGYTDTVGSKEANHELSLKRAKAIAGWFQAKGVTVGIFYQGFGEDVLAVATPDDTPEEKNRRAVYVLSAGPPDVTAALPALHWQRL